MFTVYSKTNCPMCDKAKALLASTNSEYQVIEIVENNAGDGQINKADFINKFPGIRSVPYITFNDDVAYKTFAELDNALKKRDTVNAL